MTTAQIPATSSALSLRERAAIAATEAGERATRALAEDEARRRAMKVTELRERMSAALGVAVSDADIICESTWQMPPARVTVDGLAFGACGGPYGGALQVATVCARRCGEPLWVDLEMNGNALARLHEVLRDNAEVHGYDCLVKFDDDGEPITDRDGNPLPQRGTAPRLIKENCEDRLINAVREIVRDEVRSMGGSDA